MIKRFSFFVSLSSLFLGGMIEPTSAKLLKKVVSCPCSKHKNTEVLDKCKKQEGVLKPFDFHLNVLDGKFSEGQLTVKLRHPPEVVSDRPGMHEQVESATCVGENVKRLGDNEVVYVLWKPGTQGVVVFKGSLLKSSSDEMTLQVTEGTDEKAIHEILASQKQDPESDCELAILSYAVMTKKHENSSSKKKQLHDRVNYFMISEGPVTVNTARKLTQKYPYDITFKEIQKIIRIDVTGKREDLSPEEFIKRWSSGPNSFALSPPDGNFTLRMKDKTQVFNAMRFNGPPQYTKEGNTFVLQGQYLEGPTNKPLVPSQLRKERALESDPGHHVGVFLDLRNSTLPPV